MKVRVEITEKRGKTSSRPKSAAVLAEQTEGAEPLHGFLQRMQQTEATGWGVR